MGFTLVRVRYAFAHRRPFYPLFYRESNGTILYPRRGEGWYWYPEYSIAADFAAQFGTEEFTVIEWWHFQTQSDVSPFTWIEDYFERRKQLVNEAKRTGVPNGEEKTLKLGYNGCYGKTAQQVGARLVDGEIQPPPYFQLEWAGYVTAGCRAQIMAAAMQNPDAIISIATDGIFSTAPLSLSFSANKELGAWEAATHDGMTIVMPGVYWLHDGEQTKHYSRGFAKVHMQDIKPILSAWARGDAALTVPITRLITLGSACMSDSFYEMRGMFVTFSKELRINGDNSKRYPLTSLRSRKPHRGLVDTIPRDLWEPEGEEQISAPYRIDWLEPDALAEAEGGDFTDADLNADVLAAFLA